MKPFSAFVKNNPAIMARIEQVKKETVQHPEIKPFLEAHAVTDDMIDKDLTVLQEYKDQSKLCDRCASYGQCINFVKGHTPHLYIEDNRIKISYTPCPNKKVHDEEQLMKQYVTAMHVPYETLNAKINSIDLEGTDRLNIVKRAMEICNDIAAGRPTKGLYIYGSFGTGKSYILGAIANQLKERHIYTTIFYVPEFIRELKNGFNDQTYAEKLDRVKKSPVLMLDDIGAEDMTTWVRDEVLGPLLHYRMMNQLPTFFSSNFNKEELRYHFQKTKVGEEKTKAYRMMERIDALTEAYPLNGKNYRRS
ncbi:primosomal protein DnaI [Macrococcus brunensis]|uniref:primosomal protein DnaI n=1 Tax=Macrococcus brunensis TaxID=198483 RepID=UPI001EF01A2B|nr:primosomal protein DnaI [Macrococcus brunensis]ULG71293.1 primosomal protein DnaI [Macrococcus brunensis]ULG73599.1 primosomal protein DnaI [Macrococcus brunensis]